MNFRHERSLTPELQKFVSEEVGSGLYQTASEVIRAGLRRLKEEHGTRKPWSPRTLEELEEALNESIASLDRGEGIDGEDMFRQLRQRIKRAKRRA